MDENRMKRNGHLFDKLCSFRNLLESFKSAFRGSGRTIEACRFHFNLEKNLHCLKEKLEKGTYYPYRYKYFKIYDPKERTISVASFSDRVVHHALVKVLEPIFERRFIYDSYATRKGKGTHRAVLRAMCFTGRNRYYLKTDIEKYFDNIDHDVMVYLVEKTIKDEKVTDLVKRILQNNTLSRGDTEGKGIPVGNLTSQFFANVYLDPLDHYVKDELGFKYYVRYMDDIVLFSDSLFQLKSIKSEIQHFLDANLSLKLKQNGTAINTRLHGLPFLGFRIFPNTVRINNTSLKRIKKRYNIKLHEYTLGRRSEAHFVMSAQSILAHLKFADSLKLRRSLFHRAGAL
jgi:retron-type reverse transcriptase